MQCAVASACNGQWLRPPAIWNASASGLYRKCFKNSAKQKKNNLSLCLTVIKKKLLSSKCAKYCEFLVVVGAFFPVFCFFLSTIELCWLPLVAPVRSGPAKTECVAFAVCYNFDNSVFGPSGSNISGIRIHYGPDGRTVGRSYANSSQHQWSAVPSQTYHNSHYHHDDFHHHHEDIM